MFRLVDAVSGFRRFQRVPKLVSQKRAVPVLGQGASRISSGQLHVDYLKSINTNRPGSTDKTATSSLGGSRPSRSRADATTQPSCSTPRNRSNVDIQTKRWLPSGNFCPKRGKKGGEKPGSHSPSPGPRLGRGWSPCRKV